MVRRLGVLADIYDILEKLDGLYGAVEDAEKKFQQLQAGNT